MKYISMILMLTLSLAFTTGCASLLDNRATEPVFKVATLKLIESGKYTAVQVYNFTSRYMDLISIGSESGVLGVFEDVIKAEIQYELLAIEDRILVDYLLVEARILINEAGLPEEQVVVAQELLRYVNEAAELRLALGD